MKKKREQPLILYKKYLYDNHFDKEQPEEIVPVRRRRSPYQVVCDCGNFDCAGGCWSDYTCYSGYA